MDYDVIANLYPCAHCSETGTCSTGSEGKSCSVCVDASDIDGKDHFGIVCAVCNGIGKAEPKTERMNKRIKPILAISIIYTLIAAIFISAMFKSEYFSEILAFSGTLLGSVIAYYFTSRDNVAHNNGN